MSVHIPLVASPRPSPPRRPSAGPEDFLFDSLGATPWDSRPSLRPYEETRKNALSFKEILGYGGPAQFRVLTIASRNTRVTSIHIGSSVASVQTGSIDSDLVPPPAGRPVTYVTIRTTFWKLHGNVSY